MSFFIKASNVRITNLQGIDSCLNSWNQLLQKHNQGTLTYQKAGKTLKVRVDVRNQDRHISGRITYVSNVQLHHTHNRFTFLSNPSLFEHEYKLTLSGNYGLSPIKYSLFLKTSEDLKGEMNSHFSVQKEHLDQKALSQRLCTSSFKDMQAAVEEATSSIDIYGKRAVKVYNYEGSIALKKISEQFLHNLKIQSQKKINRYNLVVTDTEHQIKSHIERLYQESDHAIAQANWFTKMLALIRDFFDHTRKKIHNLSFPKSPNYKQLLPKKLVERLEFPYQTQPRS